MKLIVDIEPRYYKNMRSEVKELYYEAINRITEAVSNGTPYEDRPRGKWIIDGHHIRCNRCNEYICNTDREGNKIPDNFCPNCGADMRKPNCVTCDHFGKCEGCEKGEEE